MNQESEEYRTSPVGYDDTPFLPGQPWRVHDIKRPHPKTITPGRQPGDPPSDAIVLFNGKDLSEWVSMRRGTVGPARWKVQDGHVEVVHATGSIFTREKFGDCQLHIEWASPAKVLGDSQWRGNSGVLFMSRYEIQVLDSFNNVTYADGQAGAIYGQWPPLVNASRGPGEWQIYDIVFRAPKWKGDTLLAPAYVTVFHNGALLHDHQELGGDTPHRRVGVYVPHGNEEPLELQNHDTPVRYRNIWIRRLAGYDQA
jgi:hypothetical protein